jgi:hypothetical protein
MSQQDARVKVSCYSGYIYPEEPWAFVWQGKKLGVKSIEKVWREPGKRQFRVVTDEGKLFDLCYNEADNRWSAVEF